MNLVSLQQAGVGPFLPPFSKSMSYFSARDNKHVFSNEDVIYYGGGTDVNPELYHEVRGPWTNVPDRGRDELEKALFKMYQGRVKGFLGVCRGSQFLTVMNGGKLVQDVGNFHCRNHKIQTLTGHTFEVTSTHHQMMNPFELPEKDYIILGWSQNISSYYQKGDKTYYPSKIFQREPEIVWYPKSRSLCIQGHPEYLDYNHPFPAYCRFLIKEYLLK